MLTRCHAGSFRWCAAAFAALAAVAGGLRVGAGWGDGERTDCRQHSWIRQLPRPQPITAPRNRGRSCGPARRRRCWRAAGDRPYDKTFDDLRFEMTVGEPFHRSMLTKDDRSAGGPADSHPRLHPADARRSSGIAQFVLVRDNQECCFGPGAALYDCILVEMQPGQDGRVFDPPGGRGGDVRHPRDSSSDGKHLAIYHLDGESVQ